MSRKMNGNGRKGNQEPDKAILTAILLWVAEIGVLVLLLFHIFGLVVAEVNHLMRGKML